MASILPLKEVPLCYPSVPDWRCAPIGYNWFAIDESGLGYFFKNKPVLWKRCGIWAVTKNGPAASAGKFNTFSWHNSLTKRPKEKAPEESDSQGPATDQL